MPVSSVLLNIKKQEKEKIGETKLKRFEDLQQEMGRTLAETQFKEEVLQIIIDKNKQKSQIPSTENR